MFKLDKLVVFPTANRSTSEQEDVDEIECTKCRSKDYTSENPIILCDGDHNGLDCGYHINCLDPPIGHVPEGDWLCPTCIAAGHLLMIGRIGKRKYRNATFYLVVWQGQVEPTWQDYKDIPAGSRDLVRDFNRTDRRTKV